MKTRDEYVAKLKSQLDRWNADMSQWETQAKRGPGGFQGDLRQAAAGGRRGCTWTKRSRPRAWALQSKGQPCCGPPVDPRQRRAPAELLASLS